MDYRKCIFLLLIAFALGLFCGSSWSRDGILPNVFPDAKERFITKLARLGLRVLLFAEPPPPDLPRPVMHQLGDDGYMSLDHGASL